MNYMSDTPLNQIKAAKHAAATFIDSVPGTDMGTGSLRVILSNDLQNWWSLEGANYPTASIRDPSVMIENGIYYFLSGNSLWSTKDFIDWENITINLANNDGMLWASEFFEDADHCHHIVYSATASGDNNADHFKLYVADLSDNMQVSNRHQIVSLPVTINSPIDANISLIDNNYYLWLADDNDKNTGGSALHFFKSDNYLNGWTEITTNINSYRGILANETQFEAPELIFDGQFAYLFFDPYGTSDRPGLCYSVAKADNLTNWTTPKVIGFNDFKARHMGLFPETEATEEKLVMLGDSITQGWDGSKTVAQPLSTLIHNATDIPVTNLAQGGSEVSGDRDNDAATILANNNFIAYDYAIIMYGTNDFNLSTNNLDQVTQALQTLIARLRTDNSAIIIIGVVPIQSFLVGNSMDDIGQGGYSQNQLCDAELKTYQVNGCYTLDWRNNPIVTPDNRTTTLGDNKLHPTQATYELMADRIEQVLLPLIKNKLGVKQVTLERLSDDVEPFLLSNAYQNGATIFKSINELYQDLDGLFYFGVPTLPTIIQCPSNDLNRTAYLWLNQLFSLLQDALNSLIIRFNQYGIVGAPNYTDTPQINLWRPKTLGFADYKININNNWQSIEDKLNGCYLYIAPYLKEGVS